MYSNKDKLYLQTTDMPTLKNKINKAIELSRELTSVLNDLENYKVEFEINAEKEEIKNTPVAGTTDVIPPHEFPLLNHQEYQRIYKEAQQEVPKEEMN